MKRRVRGKRIQRPWTAGEVGRLLGLLGAGHSRAAAARALNRTPNSVGGALHRLGLRTPAPPWRRKAGQMKLLAYKFWRKFGGAEAADRLGVSRSALYAALARGR